MTTTPFPVPAVDAAWAASHETHIAVATAIHAISGGPRTPEVICEDPTPTEFGCVYTAVEDYVHAGAFPAEDNGRYVWGIAAIQL